MILSTRISIILPICELSLTVKVTTRTLAAWISS
jgi:hypothetical protein